MTTAEPPAVAIEGVSHCYGRRQALNDVTFSIAPSTFAVLLGNYETNLLAKSASDLADFHTRQDHAPRFAGKGQGNCTWSVPGLGQQQPVSERHRTWNALDTREREQRNESH